MKTKAKTKKVEPECGSLETHLRILASVCREIGSLEPRDNGRAQIRFWPFGIAECNIEIEPSDMGDSDRVWDQCKVNGIHVGNRCGATHAVSMIAAACLSKFLAANDNVVTHPAQEPLCHDAIERQKLYATISGGK